MIGSITGVVQCHRGMYIVLVTSGGVGYLVAVRTPLDYPVGSSATLHTYLAVRENALDLYGFTQPSDLSMFEALITIPKIGPKTALQILIQADTATLKQAIVTQDPVYLTKMSGIGKKTAEKIVAELKESIGADLHSESIANEDTDVMDALLTLGYAHKDVRDALARISPTITDTKKRITEALRLLTS